MGREMRYLTIAILTMATACWGEHPNSVLDMSFERIDGGTNVVDLSGEGNDGTINGDPVLAAGKFGRCLDFDGTDDYVEVGTLGTFGADSTTSTISMWFKTSIAGTPLAFLGGVVNAGDETIYQVAMGRNNAGDIDFFHRDDINGADKLWLTSASGGYNDGQWHHLAVTVDITSSTWRIYIDGESVPLTENETDVISPSSFASSFILGARNNAGTPQNYFNGKIDSPRIYNIALMQSDIRRVMMGLQPLEAQN